MKSIETLTVDTLRMLSVEGVEKAKSGHPGLPLGAAPAGYAVWAKHLKHHPKASSWIDRDRFVLSAGHGSMLLYSLLHVFGYDCTIDDLKNFRQLGSRTPGHPEYGLTDGVEATTGPLGQGIANAVGMAMAERFLAAKFNQEGYPIFDHYTYALHGDGCLMEGVSYEAASLAGTLGLSKLILLYDSNNITIEGNTDSNFTEDVEKRFLSMHWNVIKVLDGNDLEEIDRAIQSAKAQTEKPSILIIKSQIGYASPKAGSEKAHGEPLGQENLEKTKHFLAWTEEPFSVPVAVKEHIQELSKKNWEKMEVWNQRYEEYKTKYPVQAQQIHTWFDQTTKLEYEDFEQFLPDMSKTLATRVLGGEYLNVLAKTMSNLIGGSADLNPSTKTYLINEGDYDQQPSGRNVHFGVREHAMGSIANGMCYHGGVRPFVSTFFVFSDYMKPAIRLAAISKLPVLYIFTHDSIGVGEDGPTHQPVEHLAALRSLAGIHAFRPADAKEVLAAMIHAMNNHKMPTALLLTRQNLPSLSTTSKEAMKGGYIVLGDENTIPEIILLSSGSELHITLEAGKKLQEKGILARVVSMPCVDLFEEQSAQYKEKVLPSGVRKRVSVEASSKFGWHQYVGLDGVCISIDAFGESAPANKLYEHFGLTTENIVQKATALLNA